MPTRAADCRPYAVRCRCSGANRFHSPQKRRDDAHIDPLHRFTPPPQHIIPWQPRSAQCPEQSEEMPLGCIPDAPVRTTSPFQGGYRGLRVGTIHHRPVLPSHGSPSGTHSHHCTYIYGTGQGGFALPRLGYLIILRRMPWHCRSRRTGPWSEIPKWCCRFWRRRILHCSGGFR